MSEYDDLIAAVQAKREDPEFMGRLRRLIDEHHESLTHLAPDPVKTDWTRDELLDICEKALVPQDLWSDRDTAHAQRQVGECRALLKAGCSYGIITMGSTATDYHTIWLTIEYRGFDYFETGGHLSTETFYLPTPTRLWEANGGDWY